jgi:hypothetical protein
MTWNLKQITIGANTTPNTKKGELDRLAPSPCNNRTSHQKSEALKDVSLDGGYAGLAIGAVHCELDGWQVSNDCCQICHP